MGMALHRLSSLTVGVPDVSAVSGFYDAFGLARLGEGRFATRDGGEQLRLQTAPYRRLEAITVGVDDADDLGRIGATLVAAGHRPTVEANELRVDEVHAGIEITVRVEARQATAAAPVSPVNRPGVVERMNQPADVVMNPRTVQPASLSHVVLGTPNYEATLSFFVDLLGFQTSDQIPGIISFNRCSEMHHNVAIQATPGRLLHHFAFEVDSVDDVLRGGSNMIEADAERHMWGLGRHAIGSNWFWYLKDPAGNFVEYTADLDHISAQDLYVPKQWEGKEYLYAYGPSIPDAFLQPTDALDIFASQQP
jgi:catechol 2,3-dioxygenase-like lactoylglutathione lyase family enzyme